MVQERTSVFIGVLFESASRMLGNVTKNGPFHADRPERRMAEGYIWFWFSFEEQNSARDVITAYVSYQLLHQLRIFGHMHLRMN